MTAKQGINGAAHRGPAALQDLPLTLLPLCDPPALGTWPKGSTHGTGPRDLIPPGKPASEAPSCGMPGGVAAANHAVRFAHRIYELPKRLEKFGLEVAPEKTQVLRFSRFHPSMTRRVTFLGFELFSFPDRERTPRVKRRTAHKKLQDATQRIKDWIKSHRHLPGKEFIRGLNRRLVGHYNYYGPRGNSHDLWRFFQTTVEYPFKWLNRRGGKRKSFTWQAFNRALAKANIAKPRITERPIAQRVFT